MKHDVRSARQALDRVLVEARTETVPELDWTSMEARLVEDELESAPFYSPAAARPRSRSTRVVLLAAAAALALGVGWVLGPSHAPLAILHQEDTSGVRNGDVLPPGALVDATANDVAVEHSGHSRWTLERGSVATVTSSGGVVNVHLERGSVVARVVPSPRPETFVVEAADTRVAVHGTAFRVVLAADHVDVSVTEGSVLVGPRSQPGAGQRVASSTSRFTLGGEPETEPTAEATRRERPAERRSATGALPKSELAGQPSVEAVEGGVSRVLELAASCFQRRTATSNGVRVTASTTVTVRALPNGSLVVTGFEPPLAPGVQACVVNGARTMSIAESQRGITVSRRIDLER